MGVSIVMGCPKNGLVFVRENTIYKWMMTGGTPMTQETPICDFWANSIAVKLLMYSHVNHPLSLVYS